MRKFQDPVGHFCVLVFVTMQWVVGRGIIVFGLAHTVGLLVLDVFFLQREHLLDQFALLSHFRFFFKVRYRATLPRMSGFAPYAV